jgi:peptidyl-prolyl cis-trans isomerase SurA
VKRIRVEKGIFKLGDSPLVDRDVFKKKDVEVKTIPDYPIDATYGKVLKAPKEYTDVRGQVVADYQDQLEKEWVAELRKRLKLNEGGSVYIFATTLASDDRVLIICRKTV